MQQNLYLNFLTCHHPCKRHQLVVNICFHRTYLIDSYCLHCAEVEKNALVWCWFLAQMIEIFMSIDRTNNLIKRLKSVRLLPLVKPLDPIKLAISVCSIKRLGETPDQKVLVPRTTNNRLWSLFGIEGCNFVIFCRNQYNELP